MTIKTTMSLTLRTVLLAGVMGWMAGGCATAPYRYGQAQDNPYILHLKPEEPQIERGRPIKVLDIAGNVVSLPSKVLLWNWKVDNHNISRETEAGLKAYLATNQLTDVKVRLNQFAPGNEWKRLFANRAVGAGWRYTFGLMSMIEYSIYAGRLFGGDCYNPYTDTISLYSDLLPIAVHEGGHAKDFARRTYKGTYAFVFSLPLLTLYPEAVASSDALSYFRAERGSEDWKAGYKLLYPAYATYIGGEIAQWLPTGYYYPVYLGAVLTGHIVGRVKAATIPDDTAKPVPAEAPAPANVAAPAATKAPAPAPMADGK